MRGLLGGWARQRWSKISCQNCQVIVAWSVLQAHHCLVIKTWELQEPLNHLLFTLRPRTRLARTTGCFCDFKLSGRKIYFSIGRSSIEQKIISLRRKARHPPIQTGNRCQHQISFLRLQSVPREPKTQSQLSWMLLESNITGRLTILFTTLPCQELFICLHQERICQPFFCRKQRMATGHWWEYLLGWTNVMNIDDSWRDNPSFKWKRK